MENSVNSTFSQSILDKFRSISQDGDKTKPNSAGVNGNDTESQESSNGNVNSNKRKIEKNDLMPGIKEIDVGITQYISSIEGFSGIIKHRFSDFQVNEIDPSGNVIELTSLQVPVEETEEDEKITDILEQSDWDKILEIVNSNDKDTEPLLIDVTERSKEERTTIHTALKKVHGSKLISNTKEVDDKKYIEIKKKTKREGRSDWPRNRGGYLHCAMFKVHRDTTELLHLISSKLRTKVGLIGYAGTKDKRAKTTQKVSFKRKSAEAILRLNIFNVMFGNFSYEKSGLLLGNNKGNRFQIAIRNITASDDVVEKNLTSLCDHGFINYFGLQRFGSNSQVPTYVVGKALLASDWKLAVDLILRPRPNLKGKKEMYLALQSWNKDKDAKTAIRWVPRFDHSLEAKILRTLRTQGNNAFMNALMALPRHTLTMYLHSYQSLIWNRIVSKRIEKYGLKPVAGDLIVVEETTEIPDEEKNQEDSDSEQTEDKDNDQERPAKITRKMKVRVISEDELDSISISDIVYPLAGHDITYPDNEIKDWYGEILAESNFSVDDLNNTHKHFALGGAYRRMLAKLEDLSWRIVHFDDLDQDLILSDEDKLKDISLPELNDEGEFKGVVLSFNLDSCCYATMALREIMKCDTSSHHHSQLTEKLSESLAHKDKKQKT